MYIECVECHSDVDEQKLLDIGLIECTVCGSKLVHHEEALTIVDEIPHDEYLGG